MDPPSPGVVAVGRHQFAQIGLLLGDSHDQVGIDLETVRDLDDIVSHASQGGFVVGEVAIDEDWPGVFFGQRGFDLKSNLGESGEGDGLIFEISDLLSDETTESGCGSYFAVGGDGKNEGKNCNREPQNNLEKGFHGSSIQQTAYGVQFILCSTRATFLRLLSRD